MQSLPFHRGAEADLFREKMDPWEVVVKKRVPKAYRDKRLDANIRKERTISEASLIHESKLSGVNTPTILGVSLEDTSLTMSYIPGQLARDALDEIPGTKKAQLFRAIGEQIGLLHQGRIAHGDMTTSNIILLNNKPVLIDFGMAHRSVQLEDQAVDLHLIERSIATSHTGDSKASLKAISNGYEKIVGTVMTKRVREKTAEIERRGRYFAIR